MLRSGKDDVQADSVYIYRVERISSISLNRGRHLAPLPRREFFLNSLSLLGYLSFGFSSRALARMTKPDNIEGVSVFKRIVAKSTEQSWRSLPIGDVIVKVGAELSGTRYKGGTLDVFADKENCIVNLTGLDCVTFVETCLAFARMLKKGLATPANLLFEVEFLRYRGGTRGDFTTRLHYTSDWLFDNQNRSVVQILGDLPGSKPLAPHVNFMSKHYTAYKQLVAHPELLREIEKQEAAINARVINFVPTDRIAAVEPHLQNGDVVCVCTNQPGLDIVHLGLVDSTPDGVRHFMDASSRTGIMKVLVEPGRLHRSLKWSNTITGAIFARPSEPR